MFRCLISTRGPCRLCWVALAAGLAASAQAYGERDDFESPVQRTGEPLASVTLHSTAPDSNQTLGTLKITQRATGVVIEPSLKGLEPGLHGFVIYEGSECPGTQGQTSAQSESTATASPSTDRSEGLGDHWDPGIKGNHAGPWAEGHRGDLPNLYVDPDGQANTPVYVPQLSVRDLTNRALVVHSQRDTYSDEPDTDGGIGAPVGCGVLASE